MAHGTTLVITVADSGDGVPAARTEDIFEEGVSSKEDTSTPGGRGVGLALVRQIARSRGGEVDLVTPGGPGDDEDPGGAVFVARLPGVLEEAR